MNEFQLKRFVIEDAMNVRHCFAQRLVILVASKQVGPEIP